MRLANAHILPQHGHVARRILTRDQAEIAKKRAASFTRNVLHDEGRADEIEGEGVDSWAEETGHTITNPRTRRPTMPQVPTKDELQETIDDIGDIVTDALDPALTREEVVQKLQEIDDMLNGDDDSDDDSDDDGNGDDGDDSDE